MNKQEMETLSFPVLQIIPLDGTKDGLKIVYDPEKQITIGYYYIYNSMFAQGYEGAPTDIEKLDDLTQRAKYTIHWNESH